MANVKKWLRGAAFVSGALVVVGMTSLNGVLWTAAAIDAASATLTVAPQTAPAGDTVTFSGSLATTGTPSCPAGEPVTLTSSAALFPGDGFGPNASRSGTTGSFSVTYVVPTTTPAGTYVVGIRCGGGDVGITASLTVTSGAAVAVPGQPSLTG
jgi:hypothetical protein